MKNETCLDRFRTLEERDLILEQVWKELGDIPMDPETEKIEEDFYIFPKGTDREEIWHWFDKRHSKGVAYLLYADSVEHTPEITRLAWSRSCLCSECSSSLCIWNPEGICLFPLISGRKAIVTGEGCNDCIAQ